MNKKQQQKHVGQSRRLRPKPTNSLGAVVDDAWTVVAADDTGLQLANHRTGHTLRLGYDHILEYRTPDFLILKSQVHLTASTVSVEPIVAVPKVVLDVKRPLPASMQNADGLWIQEIHVHPSKPDAVPDATVEILFHAPYLAGSYEVVSDNSQGLILSELFGVEGTHSSDHFRMGLVELPRTTWIRLVFTGHSAPIPREIRLSPYFKH